MTDNEQNLLAEYRRLHDWLSEIVEDAERNNRGQIVMRAARLIEQLVELARLDALVQAEEDR